MELSAVPLTVWEDPGWLARTVPEATFLSTLRELPRVALVLLSDVSSQVMTIMTTSPVGCFHTCRYRPSRCADNRSYVILWNSAYNVLFKRSRCTREEHETSNSKLEVTNWPEATRIHLTKWTEPHRSTPRRVARWE